MTRGRWFVLGVFVLSTAINYLDRSALATLAPLVRAEFHLSNAEYGLIVSAFSIAYAAGAPAAGWLIDRLGLTRGITLAVTVWSLAAIASGFSRGLAGLLAARAALGLGEAGGIPAAGKAIHAYLRPAERALGNSLNQAAVSVGLALAPPVATFLAVRHGWRAAFIATGALGLLWIPLWHRLAPGAPTAVEPFTAPPLRPMLALLAANALSMMSYSLWTNWTTLYLIDARGLGLAEAAWYAWIPPVFATLGGAAGGWLSYRWIRGGMAAFAARLRVCLFASLAALATAAIPWLPGADWATAGISLSLFAVAAFSVNLYTMPLDRFGGASAAFTVSLLVSAYGAMQAVASPAFGWLIDGHGYAPACTLAAVTPLAAYAVLTRNGAATP